MNKSLIKINNNELYFYRDGVKHVVKRNDNTTYPTGLYGNISSELYGDISGLYGDCANIKGNLNDCELSDENREKGININDLVK